MTKNRCELGWLQFSAAAWTKFGYIPGHGVPVGNPCVLILPPLAIQARRPSFFYPQKFRMICPVLSTRFRTSCAREPLSVHTRWKFPSCSRNPMLCIPLSLCLPVQGDIVSQFRGIRRACEYDVVAALSLLAAASTKILDEPQDSPSWHRPRVYSRLRLALNGMSALQSVIFEMLRNKTDCGCCHLQVHKCK